MTLRRYFVVGTPIADSLSPALHNAVYQELGLPRILEPYDPIDVAGFESFLQAIRQDDQVGGACVTLPYKVRAAELCDTLTETARRIGAVNYLRREADGTLTGENTDAAGFRSSLYLELGLEPRGLRVCVCSSGGVSRAIVDALQQGGAAEVQVVSRRGSFTYADLLAAPNTYDLLVNATPLGMTGDTMVVPPEWAHSSVKAVFDAVYRRTGTTPLVAEARRLELAACDGRSMLIEQAIKGMCFWGIDGDEAALRSIMRTVI